MVQLPLGQVLGDGVLTLAAFLFIVALIILVERLCTRGRISHEAGRKLIHLSVGLLVSCAPLLFHRSLPVILLSLIFVAVNFVFLKSTTLAALSLPGRKTLGTVYFPVSILLLAIFWWDRPVTFILATLTMTLADTAATAIGERQSNLRSFILWQDKKSFAGSFTMFVVTFIIIGLGSSRLTTIFLPESQLPTINILGLTLLVSLLATLAEATSKEGSDNLSVPLLTALFYDLALQHFIHQTWSIFLLWTVFSALLLWIAWYFELLSPSGAVGGYLMGVLIFGAGGWSWIVPIMVFFILASLLSRLPNKRSPIPRTANRDILQVLANGSLPTLLAMVYFYQPQPLLYYLYLAALSAANADTWATEIGSFSKALPRLIVSGKQVQIGASGGVTLLGLLGSVGGALTIAAVGFIYTSRLDIGGVIVIAGAAGSLVDSLLGSTLQGIYHCPQCGQTVEMRYHCERKTNLKRGYPWMDNNIVNLLNTFTGGLVAFIFL
ncbi:MAG: DUF92 domain-containing protein [Fidelibacterota bacterium]